MAINSFDGLSAAILAWCNRSIVDTDFAAQVPLFISLAELQIFLDIPTLGTQQYVTANFTINNGTYPKPALWGRTLTLSCINSVISNDPNASINVLQRVSYEYGLQYNQTNGTGLPLYYTDFAYGYFYVFPTPDQNYPFQFSYYTQLDPLTPSNQTNWTTENAPDMLFYLSMSKAQLYLKNFSDATSWETLYKDRSKILNDYDQGRLWDRTAEVTTKGIPFQTASGA